MKIIRSSGLQINRFGTGEHIFASAWEQSKTGLLSGVSWYSLPEEDKALYRQIYFENRIKKEPLRRYSTEDEMEISLAWARSATGRKTGVPWSKPTNAEREFHRNNYEASLKMRSMQPRDRNYPRYDSTGQFKSCDHSG